MNEAFNAFFIIFAIMRMLLLYILLVAFSCQQTTVNGQQTPFLESENLKNSESEKGCEQRAMSHEPFLESENLKTSEPENVLESHHYFIVGGSFQTLDRAEFCLKDIRSQGFENASLLEKNDKGYIRVYYESFVEKSDALIRLDVIKNDFNESAWLLFQK